jgi:tRNA-modifying protein YgfZ
MEPLAAPAQELAALEQERAFVDLSEHRKVRVRGGQARAWLHDLVTCDVASLPPWGSRRSLLLSPTGRIRADFCVALDDEGLVLLQGPDQPDAIGRLLAPYVLSSDVSLHDVTNELSLFAIPGSIAIPADPAEIAGRPVLRPSVLGPGVDLLVAVSNASRAEDVLIRRGLQQAGTVALEVWRIRRGVPRMGADFWQDALPAEVGLEGAIDLTKGCFLGQEAVARVRNLGHPPRVLRHVRGAGPLAPDGVVMAEGHMAGVVTSAAESEASGGVVDAIVRVRWEFAEAALVTEPGAPLDAVGSMG